MFAKYLFGGIFLAVKAGLTGISGAATTFTTSATTLQYCIGGKAYTKAQVSGGATPTTDAVTGAAFVALAASKACAVVWGFDSAGNLKCAQGPIVSLDSGNNFVDGQPPAFPTLPDTICPIAYTLHKNGSTGSAWTFGTSNWNATGMTNVVQDVLVLPDRPQTS